MKTMSEIKSELERLYKHRLQLRMDRKLKKCCRNCKNHIDVDFDLGDFGKNTRYVCKLNLQSNGGCENYNPVYNEQLVEEEMISDLKDPSVCGAKEPKIAALMWVLHDDEEPDEVDTVFKRIKRIFSVK